MLEVPATSSPTASLPFHSHYRLKQGPAGPWGKQSLESFFFFLNTALLHPLSILLFFKVALALTTDWQESHHVSPVNYVSRKLKAARGGRSWHRRIMGCLRVGQQEELNYLLKACGFPAEHRVLTFRKGANCMRWTQWEGFLEKISCHSGVISLGIFWSLFKMSCHHVSISGCHMENLSISFVNISGVLTISTCQAEVIKMDIIKTEGKVGPEHPVVAGTNSPITTLKICHILQQLIDD